MNNAEQKNSKVYDIAIDVNKPLGPQMAQVPEEHLKQLLAQANDAIALSSGQAMIASVVNQIKEIPVLPSEVPTDTNPIIHVDLPKEGGVLTHMKNFEYPYKGFPFYEFVDKIDTIKKLGRSFLSGIFHQLKGRNKLWFITLIPSMWFAGDVFRATIYSCYRVIERVRIKKERYCTAMREFHRAFSVADPNEKFKDIELREQLRDTVCMLLEMDNAYRFRVQDIIVELNKDSLKKNAPKELVRILSIMQERESDQRLKDTWKLVKLLIKFYIRFDKKITRMIVNGLLQLDLEKVKLSIEDKAYCVTRVDYTFGFAKNPTKEDQSLIAKNALLEKHREEKSKIIKESTNAHQEVVQKYNPLTPENNEKFRYDMGRLDEKYNKLLKTAEEQYALERAKL